MLDSLYAGALADAAKRESVLPLNAIEKLVSAKPKALNALAALEPAAHIKLLAEIKRASPSRGKLANISSPADLARVYASSGASAISVLTEERKFQGSLDDLIEVRSAVPNTPLLRKDFIANEYQILEARLAGADIILLIVAGLEPKRLIQLLRFVEELGMTPFVETHSHDEVSFAVDTGARLVGINARDLSTFHTDRDLFATLAAMLPTGVIKVAESAVRDANDVRHYRSSGADVVLVGEALVTGQAESLIAEFISI